MATETEKLYTESTQTGAGTGTTPATAPNATSPYVTGNQSLDNYNTARFNQLNQLYDSNRDAALNQLEAGHNRTMSDAQAAYDKISPKYQASRNESGAEYERQRRNNNMQAAANGLNTGAASQMQLAASNAYQTGQAQLRKAENEALNEADRNMLTMKEQYEADVANALAKNDSERAAALLNEYGQQYDRMMSEAKQLASYGDFSLYKTLYGDEAANAMEQTWLLQNPQLAYTMGRITADQYFSMTGKYPPGYNTGSTAGSYGGGYGYGGSGGSSDDSAKLTYKQVAQARAEGYSDDQIKAAAQTAGLTGTDTAMTRASQSGVAGGKSAAGALAQYKSSSGSSTSNATQTQTAPSTWDNFKNIFNSIVGNNSILAR